MAVVSQSSDITSPPRHPSYSATVRHEQFDSLVAAGRLRAGAACIGEVRWGAVSYWISQRPQPVQTSCRRTRAVAGSTLRARSAGERVPKPFFLSSQRLGIHLLFLDRHRALGG